MRLFFLFPKTNAFEKQTLSTCFGESFSSWTQKLNIHDVFWTLTHSLNKHIYLLASKYILIPRFGCIPKEMSWNTRKWWLRFKTLYICIMTNRSLFWTFKRNISQIKILADAVLNEKTHKKYIRIELKILIQVSF